MKKKIVQERLKTLVITEDEIDAQVRKLLLEHVQIENKLERKIEKALVMFF